MPMNGSGTASRVPGTTAVPNSTIKSADYNASTDDIYSIFNTPRPIVYGGTNGTSAVTGGDNLSTKGSDIASATTTDIGAATGRFIHVTGTTTITGLGTIAAGVVRVVVFDASLTLTHNATSLILPGGNSIVTSAGDAAIFMSEGAGNWRCINYERSKVLWEPVGSGKFTLSAASSLNVTDLSAYRILKISGTLTPSAAATGIYIRSSTNNGVSYDSGAADYTNQTLGGAGAGVGAAQTNDVVLAIVKNSVISISFETILFNFGVTGNMQASSRAYTNLSAGGVSSEINGGQRNNTTARNAVQIIPGGAVTLTGSVIIEGIKA